MKKRSWTGIAACVGMLLLILDAKTALAGAKDGVSLCIGAVIPSLFPFFVLTELLTSNLLGSGSRFLRPLGRLCGIPEGAQSLLITGFLGGYPSGAVCVRRAYDAGQLSKADARRLLSFCSNAGPSFLFGIVSLKFHNSAAAWALWIIHILSALLVGAVLPGKASGHTELPRRHRIGVADALKRSLRTMAAVCGWVVIFRVMIAMLTRWCLWLLPREGQVTVIGILELTNGCCDLEMIENESLRFLIAAGTLGFGGLCVLMQTVSAVGDLGIGTYLKGRILCSVFSVVLAAAYQGILSYGLRPAILCPLLTFAAIILMKIRKNSSNPAAVVV